MLYRASADSIRIDSLPALHQTPLSRHYNLTTHENLDEITFSVGSQEEQRRSANLIPLLNPHLNRVCAKVFVFNQIARQTAIGTACRWVFDNVVVIGKHPRVDLIIPDMGINLIK